MDGRGWVLMVVPIAFCGGMGFGDSDGSLRNWLWLGGAGFSWNFPTLVVGGGEAVFLMAVPIAGRGQGRQGFSWQSQMLVVGGEAGVLISVLVAGCRWERRGISWQF